MFHSRCKEVKIYVCLRILTLLATSRKKSLLLYLRNVATLGLIKTPSNAKSVPQSEVKKPQQHASLSFPSKTLYKQTIKMDNDDTEMDCGTANPSPKRDAPNILITGTPGVGKSTLCQKLSETTGMRWLEISKVAKDNNCLEEYDPVYKCPVLDEDKLLDGLEETVSLGGNIVDYHSCDFFPERWFDLVFVLRADNTTLYDRLRQRGYEGKKLEDNLDCEIFQLILDEAKSSYKESIVHELTSLTEAQLQDNVEKICLWIQKWFEDNQV